MVLHNFYFIRKNENKKQKKTKNSTRIRISRMAVFRLYYSQDHRVCQKQ